MSGASLPPGFRFHPTDEELVGYYLKRKVEGLPIELEVIPVIDLYKFDPWELPEKSFLPKRDMEWFFFCPRDRKYPNGSRTNRATKAGYWKATGKDRKVVCQSSVSAYRKTLVFYRGRAPLGDRTDWVMHEYRLCDDNSQGSQSFQGAFALCRIMKRNEPLQNTTFIQEPLATRSASHSQKADITSSWCQDKLLSTTIDMSTQASYLCNENQLSSPFTSHSKVTALQEFEPAPMDTWTACQQVSPDLILDSSKEYSQVQETCSEYVPQYNVLSSFPSWQVEQNCEVSPSSSQSNFTGEKEYAEDLTRFGCTSPYSGNPYYMGYYENDYIPYADYGHTHNSLLQYPEPF